MTAPRRIIVIGGGITGLAAAHRLVELGAQVTLLEASDRVGGVIHTIEHDGFLLEAGPDNFITNKPWGLDLSKRLGLENQLLPTNESFRRALIVRNGKLHPIPEGFFLMSPSRLGPMLRSPVLSWRGKLRMAMEPWIRRKRNNDDESLASFVTRRFGRETLERLVQPLIGGIYTADPATLSLRATLPMFLDMERDLGSVTRGVRQRGNGGVTAARYGLFVTYQRGMQTLVEALVSHIGAGQIRLNQQATAIARDQQVWCVQVSRSAMLTADGVIVALPASAAAALLDSIDPRSADELGEMQYASSAVAQFGYRRAQIAHALDAFGFVVPHVENRSIIAGSFSSVKYAGRAPDDCVLLRAFMGGALQAGILDKNDDALLAAARADLGELLGITGEPRFAVLHRWNRAMPQYTVGHVDRIAAIRARIGNIPGVALAGNAYDGVGIPDCIRSGEQAADRMMETFTQ